MSDDREQLAPPELADHAEAVRAYLVATRGGAPLLSSTDARLLFDWLDRGVRVGVIVRAIDGVARRRIAQKVRAPLSLASCRGEVERLRRGGKPGRAFVVPAHESEAPATPAYAAAIARLSALNIENPEERCRAALAISREFFESAWLAVDQAEALQEASESLADQRSDYDESAWREACEAVARDHLRRRYPRLTATAIWTEYGLGLA